MEDKDLKDIDSVSSKYEDIKTRKDSFRSNLMDELDSLTHSLDDVFIDFEKEIEALDRRTSKAFADYGINNKKNNIEQEDEKISNLPLNAENQDEKGTSKLTSFEKEN